MFGTADGRTRRRRQIAGVLVWTGMMASSMRSPAGLAVLGVLALYCTQTAWLWLHSPMPRTPEDVLSDVVTPQEAVDQARPFREKQIIQVTEGVHVAVGFSMVNSILLEGPAGLIVVDTTLSRDVAAQIREQFRTVSHKPIRAIIYTHFHPDHTYGVQAFIDDPDDPPDIWAHEEFLKQMQITGMTGGVGFIRARRQFGIFLPESVGVAVDLGFDKTFRSSPIFPNKLVKGKRLSVNIAGIDLELVHTPGETADHLTVHWPARHVVCPGDNIYQAFPNLYAIRGTPSRDILTWVDSLDVVRSLKPAHLVPSHTLPVSGLEDIEELLVLYRDAIQYVHDQTVRWMNKAARPEDIARRVHLPPGLRDHPYLRPLYGTVPWSVRGVFDGYMGWFSGDITELEPLGTEEKSRKMVALAGGQRKMMNAAQQAYDDAEYQWALELSSHIFRVHEDYEPARHLRSQCLKRLASEQTSSNGRNFYLTQAIEDYNFGVVKPDVKAMVKQLPMSTLFHVLTTRVDAEKCSERDTKAVFEFRDTGEVYAVHLRHGIMVLLKAPPDDWDVKVVTRSRVWREIIAKERSAVSSYMLGDVVIEGGVMAFRAFMGCVEKD